MTVTGLEWCNFDSHGHHAINYGSDVKRRISKHVDDQIFFRIYHYNNVIMGSVASQITSLAIVYSTVYSGADQRKHQSSVSLSFVQGIHR